MRLEISLKSIRESQFPSKSLRDLESCPRLTGMTEVSSSGQVEKISGYWSITSSPQSLQAMKNVLQTGP